MTKTESKKTSKSKKESKALTKVEEPSTLKKFEKREFNLIRDHELATLIRDYFDDEHKPSLSTISELCKWSTKEHEICVDCTKAAKLPVKLGTEHDLITYLVHKDVLEEGNWIVIVTVE